jgi:hypothetical protein
LQAATMLLCLCICSIAHSAGIHHTVGSCTVLNLV